MLIDRIENFTFEDFQAFEVELAALGSHGISLNNEKEFVNPMVEIGIRVDPP